MILTFKFLRKAGYSLGCQWTIFCPLARLSFAQCTPRMHSSSYRRPGVLPDNTPPWKNVDFNFKKSIEEVKKHFGLLKKEIVDHWTGPEGRPLIEHLLEQTRVIWEFRSQQDLEQWVVSSDQEIGGKSETYLKLSKNSQTALLYGTLNTSVPHDGETRYSGYCSLRSKMPQGAFNHRKHHDWSSFNALHLRIRGDGRPWMVNLGTEMYFSHQKDDLYNYFMFTRGGPYWQDVKASMAGVMIII
uniref:Complex I intermediate-associated protein 30, mitochondrial n=1 Tax=Geotrypetes seraphini TaxID=260995 RepID=A0A6P8RQV1_GEOSA|nr:complex I intermediate-associated protein 30, mitochondrial isoform X2 [Geotrypetes seraphini]